MTPVLVAILGFFVAAAVAFGVLLIARSKTEQSAVGRVTRLHRQGATKPTNIARKAHLVRADRAPVFSSFLRGTSMWEELQMEILRAGLLLRPSELVAFTMLAMLIGAAAGLVIFHHIAGGVLGACAGVALPWVVIKVKQAKRTRDLATQLPDAIDMLSAALRSGFSFLRGVQTVAGQMQPPISDEFRRLSNEVQMGMGTAEALDALVDRTRCYDLELVVAAVQIWLQVGGNLSEVLDNIAETIRERIRLQGEINAATAEVRFSAGILFAMPIFIGLAVNFLNPGYLKPLFTTPVGLTMTLVAGVLMALGALVIRSMLEVDL
jgi:tight adherence protein B